jgi:hypothetical protein
MWEKPFKKGLGGGLPAKNPAPDYRFESVACTEFDESTV